MTTFQSNNYRHVTQQPLGGKFIRRIRRERLSALMQCFVLKKTCITLSLSETYFTPAKLYLLYYQHILHHLVGSLGYI